MKAIIFDCFGVIYQDSSNHFYETNVEQYQKLRPELLRLNSASDYGLISQDELTQSVADISGLSRDFISKNIHGLHIRNSVLMQFVAELRQHYKVAMLSNIGPGSMDQYIKKEEREALFDVVVLSGDIGITKPHPRLFEYVAEKLGVLPGECIMVDDIEENCAGADAAGMKPVHFVTTEQAIADIQVLLA